MPKDEIFTLTDIIYNLQILEMDCILIIATNQACSQFESRGGSR